MKISLIAAHDLNRVIGYENKLPWHVPADLKYFQDMTVGKPVIMGRKTFESLGEALPNRVNVVITHDIHFKAKDCIVVHSLPDAIDKVKEHEEIMIIGGTVVFEQALAIADQIYLTIIHERFIGDTYFPKINFNEWEETSREDHPSDELNPHAYSFILLTKKNK